MTPKEKAEKLIEKFTFICNECDYEWNAKQCALIAVDEVALILNGHHKDANTSPFIDYWKEVKQETKKL